MKVLQQKNTRNSFILADKILCQPVIAKGLIGNLYCFVQN